MLSRAEWATMLALLVGFVTAPGSEGAQYHGGFRSTWSSDTLWIKILARTTFHGPQIPHLDRVPNVSCILVPSHTCSSTLGWFFKSLLREAWDLIRTCLKILSLPIKKYIKWNTEGIRKTYINTVHACVSNTHNGPCGPFPHASPYPLPQVISTLTLVFITLMHFISNMLYVSLNIMLYRFLNFIWIIP